MTIAPIVPTLLEAFAVTSSGDSPGDGRFLANNVESHERDVVFGGQLIGQLIVAASAQDANKCVKSVHAVFARPANKQQPIEIALDTVQSGRTFSSFTATIGQADRLCSRATLLCTAIEDDVIRHQSDMPDVAEPETVAAAIDPFTGIDRRVLGGVDVMDPKVVAPPITRVWIRLPDAPDDLAVNQAVIAHETVGWVIGTSMLPHAGVGLSSAHVTLSTGVIAHAVSFHEPMQVRDWHLIVNESTHAGHGRVHGRGQVWSAAGTLVASFSQDSMVRSFGEQTGDRQRSM